MPARPRLASSLVVAVALALLAGGCGSGGSTTTPRAASATTSPQSGTTGTGTGTTSAGASGAQGSNRPGSSQPGSGRQGSGQGRRGPGGLGSLTIPTPAPTGVAPDPAAIKVIEGWSSALRHGDVNGAAGYFALPSAMINGVGANGQVSVQAIRTPAQARAANASLPCGAKLISTDQRGRYVNALFRLTGRPGLGGGSCGTGTGATARTNFLIARGRIIEWIRAPDDPGDNGGPATPSPAPSPSPPSPSTGVVPVA